MLRLTLRSLSVVGRLAAALLPVLLLLAMFSLSLPVQAAGVVGTGTPASCTEAAFDAALVGGGEITFNCGPPVDIVFTNVKTISQDTTISGGDEITLLGGGTTRLFAVNSGATLVLQNIVLGDANSGASDGGAISNSGTLILDDVIILTSQTDINHSGGAIFTDGPLFISNSTLGNNSAGSAGAIFANFGNANVTISNTFFVDNQALNTSFGYGGAIWAGSLAEVTIMDSRMKGNMARLGGAVYLSPDASVTLAGGGVPMSIENNLAFQDGGAIYSEGGTLNISRTNFTGNKAPMNTIAAGYGGTIASLGTMSIKDSSFSLSEGRFGGAVFVGGSLTAARATIEDTIFHENAAGQLGGGLYANAESTVITVTNSSFNGNSAATGGGIGRFNAQLRVYNSSITQNTATSVGGGLYVGAGPVGTEGGYVIVRDSTISTNVAGSGQGGGVYNQALLDLKNVTVKDNTNGIFNFGSVEATRINNSALHNPGSLNCDGDGTLPQSDGSNFSGDNSCAFTSSGDQQGAGLDPLLGPLTVDSYGLTFYHMPLPGSSLINAALLSCSLRDQRGALRPDVCDIGAVEYNGLLSMLYLPVIRK